jgi:hypothetical protein
MLSAIEKVVAIVVGAVVLFSSGSQPAAAISVELAKKCREMAVKVHPPQRVSPYAQAERNYFAECVKNNGTTQDGEEKNENEHVRQ